MFICNGRAILPAAPVKRQYVIVAPRIAAVSF